jgi:EmrB/QacA subfamily drug resistance transporter
VFYHRRVPAASRRVLVVFVGLMLGNALAALDATIVATALPTIVSELGGLRDYSWVGTAYLLTAMATTPLFGKLGDMYGRKRIFLVAIVVFLAGSILCGVAQSMEQLVLFRAVQGLGAGGLVAVPMAVIADLVPARELGRWIGYSGFVFALASVVGPLLGGVFAQHVSWRWAFLVNVPLGLLAFVIVSRRLDLPARRTPHRIDYLGMSLLVGAVGCVVLLTSWGGSREPWGSPLIIGLAVLAVALVALLVVRERRAREPVLPPRLFRSSIARVCLGLNLLTGLLFFAGLYFVAAFLQFVDGIGASESGIAMIPFMGSTVTATILVGRLVQRRGRYRRYPVAGTALCVVGTALLTQMDGGSSVAVVVGAAAVLGFGIGLVMQVLILAIQNAVETRDRGVATSSSMFARQLGAAVGLALLGSVLNSRLADWVPRLTPAGFDLDVTTLRGRPETLHHLPPAVRDGVADAFAHSLHAVFVWMVPIAAAAAVIALWLRDRPLRDELHQPAAGDELAVAFEGAIVR